jgi:hypothetical protein
MSAIPELNSAPYFDDYTPETKDFLRILFRPGYAVQARELNQLQSILQTQVERFGNHIFKEGSIVVGGMTTIDTKTPRYLTLEDTYLGDNVIVSGILNKEIEGVSGARGYVVAVADNEGSDPKTLIYVPQNGINFIAGEVINIVGGGNATLRSSSFTGPSSTVSIDTGIFFIKGFFVINTRQTTYLSKYSNVPDKKAGLLADIALIDEGDDETLIDNARGSYNFAAPGAHRLKINLTLTSKELGFITDTDKFIELLEVREGKLYKQTTRPTYSEIEKTLARRTFEGHGDYTVKPFLLDVQNHPTNENFLRAYIEAGKGYVKGYEFETISRQYVDVPKARDTESYNGFDVPLNYGNYVIVQLDEGFPNVSTFETLNIFNASNTIIGSCQIGSIQVHNTSLFEYKLYLFNIVLSAGTIADARYIGNGVTKKFNLTNPYFLYETDLQSYVFDTGLKSVSTLEDIDYSTKRVFTSTTTPSTSFTFSTSASGRERFQGSFGNLENEDKARDYIVINTGTGEQITNYVASLSSPGTPTSEQSITISSFEGNPATSVAGITLIATMNVNNASPRVKVKVRVKTHTGFSQTGSSSTITLASTASTADDFYNGCKIKLINGTGSGTTTYTISDYVGSTRIATISSTFGTIPDATTTYQIAPPTSTSDDLVNGRRYIASAGTNHSLSVSDGIRIIKIVNGTSPDDWFDNSKDVTNRYIFDNGQRDFSYEYANIVLRSGQLAPSGAIVVFFEYFTSDGAGFFSVDSYTDYSEVPNYVSTTGKVFDLRNCIDFRPVKETGGVYETSSLPIARTNMNVDITYYLPRIDKIVATTDRQFKVISGVSALNPKIPDDLSNGMSLYTIYLNPYTFNNLDIVPKYIENKNYTMRDIGKLEERIERVEYYALLNSLEKDTASMDILDAGGNDRFKNGFIVDTFSGHGIGDVFSPDYKCSIDFKNQECRPKFITKSFDLNLKTNESSGYARWQNGPLLTKAFTETPFITQSLASQSLNVNPFSVFSWRGTMTIDPSVDFWKDEKFRPTNIINVNGNNDDIAFGNNWAGSRWNNWQETFQGSDEDDSIEDRLARGELGANLPSVVIPLVGPGSPSDPLRWFYQEVNGVPSWISGITGEISPAILGGVAVNATPARNNIGSAIANTPPARNSATSISLGEKVVDVSSIPWMRSKVISFTVTGMKPNTVVYPFFDDINISAYVNWTSNNTTNAAGVISGTFTIPDNTFLTGDRILRLSDNSSNNPLLETTYAQARYTANGIAIHKQTETINIRPPEPEIPVYQDPLAQTFFVDPNIYPEGLFISSVDLYFKTKDTSIPVTVQIRPTVNGYPSATQVLPFAERTLNASSVNVSPTGTTATNFPFRSVVYLEPGEYSLVILANSNNYEVFIAEIGQNKIDTNELISAQPYVGSLFKSQNSSTWTAEQTQDLKFVLNRCQFTPGNFTVVLSDYAIGFTNTVYASGSNGSNLLVVQSVNGIRVGQTVAGSGIGIGAVVTSVGGFLVTLSEPHTSNVNGNVIFGGKPDGIGRADVIWLGLSSIQFKNASLSSAFVATPVSGSLGVNYQNIIPNKNFAFGSQHIIFADAESFKHRLVGTTSSAFLSPVIDLEKNVLLTIENDINSENDSSELNPTGGSARSKYITRRITLQKPADYLKVYLTAVRPSSTDIEVYYKVKSDSDSQNFIDKSWTKMEQEFPLSNVFSANDSDFKEYIFYPPIAGFNTNTKIQYQSNGVTYDTFIEFSVKIVFKSTNTSIIPKIADFRGIALDII